ncbi:MAG: hypothetical protein AMJ62_15825 [Myxococcales bacterium SG8_38]|nr:MAG: hypothetical protein AMJ62_15825 [Myxococcales bacterium SG8_38]
MRYAFGFLLAFALGLTLMAGCSDENGEGGSGGGGTGGDPFPGNCGAQGVGGGAATPESGLYGTFWPDVVLPYRACVYVNEDCTALEASTKCNIGEDDSQAHFLEVEWTNGRTDMGDECAARVGVTTELVDEIPINEERDEFHIEFSDEEGAAWVIGGFWSYSLLFMGAQRTADDGVCRTQHDYPPSFYDCGPQLGALCLANARSFPPEVVEFDFNPKRVDVTTTPANVVCEATLTHPSGVDYHHCAFKSPSGAQAYSCNSYSPSSGDIYEGVWSCTVTIPQGEEPGLWDLVMRGRDTGARLEVVSR